MLCKIEAKSGNESFDEIVDRLVKTNRKIVEKAQKLCAPLELHVSMWRGTYQVKHASVYITGSSGHQTQVESKIKPPHWDLRPEELVKRSSALESQAWAIVDEFSVPSSRGRGIRLVRSDKLHDCISCLKQLQKRIRQLGEETGSEAGYKDIINDLKEKIDSQAAFDAAVACLPTPARLISSYDLDWTVLPTAVPEWVNEEPDSFHAKELRRAECSIAAADLITFLRAPRQRLAESAMAIDNQLITTKSDGAVAAKENRRVKLANLETLECELAYFKSFADNIEPELDKRLKEVTHKIGTFMEECRNSHLNPARTINNDDSAAFALGIAARALAGQALNEQGLIASLMNFVDKSH